MHISINVYGIIRGDRRFILGMNFHPVFEILDSGHEEEEDAMLSALEFCNGYTSSDGFMFSVYGLYALVDYRDAEG